MLKATIETAIATVKATISAKEYAIQQNKDVAESIQKDMDNFEIDEEKYEDMYIDMLDEETVYVCGMAFCPSRILSELDPIAYACGLSDYVNGIDKEDDEDYQSLVNQLEEREEYIEELEAEIEELTEELTELEIELENIDEDETEE